MKSAEDWCEDMFGRNNWVFADRLSIEAIQQDARESALKEAMSCYTKDGNPEVFYTKILALKNRKDKPNEKRDC